MMARIHNVLFREYSKEVQGYTFFTPEGNRFYVLNSDLPTADAKRAYIALVEASASAVGSKFILLQGNGQLYKSDNFKLPEKDGAA